MTVSKEQDRSGADDGTHSTLCKNSAEAYPFGRVKEQRTREKSNDDEETREGNAAVLPGRFVAASHGMNSDGAADRYG